MSKICPKCRREQEDPSYLGCEKCRVPFVDATELVTSFTRDELKVITGFLLKDWRVYVVAGIFLFVGVGLLYWQAREHIKTQIEQFHITVSNQVVTAYSTATNQLASQFKNFATDASNQVAQAYSSVTNQIAEEFQTPRIKQTVESVAKGEAKSILETEVQPAVKSFKEDAAFIRTVARAQGYDFKAYQRLLEIGRGTNDNAQLANQVVAEIDRSLQRDRFEFSPRRTYMIYSGTNLYGGPFTSDELASRFSVATQDRTSFNREGFINTLGSLKQPLFLPRLIEFFTNETDLAVADRATIAISDLAKEDFHPQDFQRIVTWWKDRHDSYTNWPFSNFDYGYSALLRGDFGVAAKSFQEVVNVDPSADMSRAFAIKSYCEIGETNKATELSKRFKDPSGRWAKWGGAFAELETGSISNATAKFVELSKPFQAISITPQEGTFFWRKLDWTLFHRLTLTDIP